MPRSLSVLVVTRDPGPALAELVAGWDAQTAPAADFEVVVADAGSADGSAERLRQLAERRPNVVVLDLPADRPDAELLGRALEVASGEHVLALDQRSRLAPRAVELLVRQAGLTQADVVLGRRRSGGASGSALLPTDAGRLDPDEAAAALPAGCAAVRRARLLGLHDPGAGLLAPAALVAAPGTTVAAVGSSLVVAEADADPLAPGLQPLEVEVGWEPGGLAVVAAFAAPSAAGSPAAWLVAAANGSVAEVAVPAVVEAQDPTGPDQDGQQPAETRWRLRAVLDPGTADAGTALADGVWALRLRVLDDHGESTVALPAVRVPGAVRQGRLFAVPAPATGQQLDVGATRSSVVGWTSLEHGRVEEGRTGTLLTLVYPDVHVRGDSRQPASVRLDGFGLVGAFVAEDGQARVECFVTGLAGTSAVSVLVGSGRPLPTGLDLVIDGTGRMSLRRTPKPAEKQPAPAEPSLARPTNGSTPADGRRPLVQRLRRLTPAAAEPAVRYLSRVGPLRDAYRRLLRR